jgi:hypothetical protein
MPSHTPTLAEGSRQAGLLPAAPRTSHPRTVPARLQIVLIGAGDGVLFAAFYPYQLQRP